MVVVGCFYQLSRFSWAIFPAGFGCRGAVGLDMLDTVNVNTRDLPPWRQTPGLCWCLGYWGYLWVFLCEAMLYGWNPFQSVSQAQGQTHTAVLIHTHPEVFMTRKWVYSIFEPKVMVFVLRSRFNSFSLCLSHRFGWCLRCTGFCS